MHTHTCIHTQTCTHTHTHAYTHTQDEQEGQLGSTMKRKHPDHALSSKHPWDQKRLEGRNYSWLITAPRKIWTPTPPPYPRSSTKTTWPNLHPQLTFLVEFHTQVDVTTPWKMSDKLHSALAQLTALPRELHHVIDAHITRGARGKGA